jgi:hypothetical protein
MTVRAVVEALAAAGDCCQGPEAAAELPVAVEGAKKSELKTQLVGLALAVYIGIANGSFTVPFKYAQKDVHGIVYVVSFGLGAAMVQLHFSPPASTASPAPLSHLQTAGMYLREKCWNMPKQSCQPHRELCGLSPSTSASCTGNCWIGSKQGFASRTGRLKTVPMLRPHR